jgi:hypothetical protein
MRLPAGAIVVTIDETILRLFPPLRAAWAQTGSQARVPVSGRNDRRVLYGAINMRTAHRIVYIGHSSKQAEFHLFLRQLRRAYAGRLLCLLLDKHGSHTAPATLRLIAELRIRVLWLPTQAPELNAMDQLWRHLKQRVAANRQYATIDEEASSARDWILSLSPTAARRLAGLMSKDNWLSRFLQNFRGHT